MHYLRVLSILLLGAALASATSSVQADKAKKNGQHCEVTTHDGHDACVEGHSHNKKRAKEKANGHARPGETWGQFKKRDPAGYRNYTKNYNSFSFLDEKVPSSLIRSMKAKKSPHWTDGLRPQRASGKKSGSSVAGGGGCANQYGGPAARHGQFICSNRGELLACQCSGNSCGVISTGSFLCTRAGAIVD